MKVSPDRKYLAYKYEGPNLYYLKIVDSNLNVIADFAKFPAYSEYMESSYFDWQNNNQIRIVNTSDNTALHAIDQYLINPFTQVSTELKTDWEGVYHPTDPTPDSVSIWKFD